jgi:acyl dehydratase
MGMPIQYPEILSLNQGALEFNYTDKDTMLYALAIGLGTDPMRAAELQFIYEKDLLAVPTLATVVAWGAGVSTQQLGVNYKMVLHGEEETIFHQALPSSGKLIADSGVKEVYDKGERRGALIVRQTLLRDATSGALIATLNRTILARGDGGTGGLQGQLPEPHSVPKRSADKQVQYQTRHDQALLYRLCGDRNPLHVDPDSALAAGFDRPILHGLCTYGITCRAVLEHYCDFAPEMIARHSARFSAPVYPGDVLDIDMWKDGDTVSFEAHVSNRGVTVIKHGVTELR